MRFGFSITNANKHGLFRSERFGLRPGFLIKGYFVEIRGIDNLWKRFYPNYGKKCIGYEKNLKPREQEKSPVLDKESLIELQKIDCNCNDCKFMERDFEKLEKHKQSYEGTGLMDKLAYGDCKKFNKPVSFIPGTYQIETQECFEHRRE